MSVLNGIRSAWRNCQRTYLADDDNLHTIEWRQFECTEHAPSGRKYLPTICVCGNLLQKVLEVRAMKKRRSTAGLLPVGIYCHVSCRCTHTIAISLTMGC